MLETSLEGFSRCWRYLLGFSPYWRLLWRDFHGAGDFFRRFLQSWRLLLEIFMVLETSLEGFSWCWRLLGFSWGWELLEIFAVLDDTPFE